MSRHHVRHEARSNSALNSFMSLSWAHQHLVPPSISRRIEPVRSELRLSMDGAPIHHDCAVFGAVQELHLARTHRAVQSRRRPGHARLERALFDMARLEQTIRN